MMDMATDAALPASRFAVQLGKHNLQELDDNSKDMNVSEAIAHKKYEKNMFLNDIGLLKLETNVTFTNFIQPICLWDELPEREVFSKMGRVVGWGGTEHDDAPANILRETSMPVIETTQCLESNRPMFGQYLTGNNFCAGYRNGTSVCPGDSGGGMFVEIHGVWWIRGLVSMGARSPNVSRCSLEHYVLFTNVAHFSDWIRQTDTEF